VKKKGDGAVLTITTAFRKLAGMTEADLANNFKPAAKAALRELRERGVDYAVKVFGVPKGGAGPPVTAFLLTARGECVVGLREDVGRLPEKVRALVLDAFEAAAEGTQNN
jgi:hypothetical protein